MKRSIIAAVGVIAGLFAGAPAEAAKVLVTVTGTVVYGYDNRAVFGPAGGSLSGKTYAARYTIDTSAPTLYPLQDTAGYSRIDGGHGYGLPGPDYAVTATLTIDGHTYGGMGQYTGYAQYYDGGLPAPAAQHLELFGVSSGQSSMSHYVFADLASAHFAQNFDFDDSSGNTQSYFGWSVNNVGTYAQFNVTHINSQILGVPEPSQWALLLGGFGFLGTAARRRRTRAAVPA